MSVAQVSLSSGGPTFSRLVAGVMTWGVWGHQLDTKAMRTLIEGCVDLGITTFDHADIYGHYTTEAEFGKALAESTELRDNIQLVSKCGIRLVCKERPQNRLKSYDTRRAYIIASVEQSLRNLRTDYLDLLLIHRPDPLLHAEEVAEAIAQLKQAGKVRAFGVSNFTPSQFAYLRSATPLLTNQVEISLLQHAALFDGTLDQCLQYGLRPMAWSPLGGLFKREDEAARRLRTKLDEIAERYEHADHDVLLLAWLLKHPAGILPVLGTARLERLKRACQALTLNLDRQDWYALLEAARGEEVA
ncbi:MAG: aldo/keto reductase [Bacteroidetes bacterium]|nr:MAG: aldo/keto reductase [Bacteroidota bacterium]